jgi:3-isopropylmalate dehydrogenase
MTTKLVAAIGGDGIGPEVVTASVEAISKAAQLDDVTIEWEHLPHSADHFLSTGETLSEESFEHLRDDTDAILVGALGDSRVPGNEHARDILLGMRFRLDLFVNFRPCSLYHPDLCPLKPHADGSAWNINFPIFRENTEGSYVGRGSATNVGGPDEEQIVEEVHTAAGVERILRSAFQWAQDNDKQLVTISDKSNAIPGHRIWRRLGEQVSEQFPGIDHEYYYVDALAMEMVRDPERFEVIVTSNLFGDILSDLGSQLVGGLGVAASANMHPGKHGLFEPVHGSAPPLTGTGQANPIATLLTGALMLNHLEAPKGAVALENAAVAAIREKRTTPDLGGTDDTTSVGKFVASQITS